jgi:hypothetical protein
MSIEVRGLVRRPDAEFLNAVRWGRHYSRWPSATRSATHRRPRGIAIHGASTRVSREARRVGVHRTVHVAGIIAAIQLERVLVLVGTSYATVWRHSRLERNESADIAPKTWQRIQCSARG